VKAEIQVSVFGAWRRVDSLRVAYAMGRNSGWIISEKLYGRPGRRPRHSRNFHLFARTHPRTTFAAALVITCLHASAVSLEGRCVAFLGSQCRKSSNMTRPESPSARDSSTHCDTSPSGRRQCRRYWIDFPAPGDQGMRRHRPSKLTALACRQVIPRSRKSSPRMGRANRWKFLE